ncbi:hypothetical protein NB713_001710 [Xanthomonas sacchari]|nr:hypothetical protein [Xanthomonas sacchari]
MRELAAAALAHCLVQRRREIGEELERGPAAPRLAHEEQRDHRGQRGQRQRRAQRRFAHLGDQPVAAGAVADLVVVLREDHELVRRQVAAGFAARVTAVVGLSLEGEAFAEHPRQVLRRRVGKAGVVALVFAGQQHVQAVVEVIVPLRAVTAFQHAGLVGLVLQHQVHVAPVGDAGHDRLAQRVEEGVGHDRMHRIQAQAVEAILVQPHQRVVDEVALHRRQAEVDRRAPGRRRVLAEEGRGVLAQVIAVRAEVVVDHIQEHAQAQAVGLVDQCLEFVGMAVGRGRRVRQHAVVAPVVAAGELGQRHQFDRGDAERGQGRQLRAQSGVAAAGAHVQFVEHRLGPGPAAPVAVAPGVTVGGQHRAGAVHAVRLPARGRIRHRRAAVDGVAVTGAGRARQGGGEVAVADRLQRLPPIVAEHQLHALGIRRPQREGDLAVGAWPGAGAQRRARGGRGIGRDSGRGHGQRSGCSQRVDSGGRVSASDCACPCIGCGRVDSTPPLPWLEPP